MAENPASSKKKTFTWKALKHGFFEAGWFLGFLALWLTFALFASIPGVFIETILRLIIEGFARWVNQGSITAMLAFHTGLRVGIALLAIIATIVVLPAIWRVVANPNFLRWSAYIAIQIVSISAGLLSSSALRGAIITVILAGGGSTAWWLWQKKWKGTGVAPSPLAGVLKPEIRSGQIWYAVIIGNQDTKIRPVVILKPAENNTWKVAYMTTQPPKPHLAEYYFKVPDDSLRGFVKDNWISLRDPRELIRKNFKSYTGLAPTWLYNTLCKQLKIEPDPHALTIDENRAGEGVGPIENIIRHAFNLDKDKEYIKENMSDNIKSFSKLNIIPTRNNTKRKL